VAESASAHRALIVAAIRRKPGMTYREIASYTGLEPVAVGRRLVEAERMGAVRPGGERTLGGRAMRTWWPW
jgi:DNA-binding MarR family transcriptional regulator